MNTGTDLFTEIFVCRHDISGPNKSTISLRTSPCTADQVYDVVLAGSFLAFVEQTGIFSWVHISFFCNSSCIVVVVVKIISSKFRFCYIQPECLNTHVKVIFLTFIPYIFTSTRIGCIHEYIVAMEDHLNVKTCVCGYQKTSVFHFIVVFTSPVNLRPYGNHSFHTHFEYSGPL